MKYLSPLIAQLAKNKPEKSLAKKGTSCGIFQDLGNEPKKQIHKQKHL